MQIQILGFLIDNIDRGEITQALERFLAEPKFHRIATVNPEFILLGQKNREFARALNDADVRIADAVGIELAFRMVGQELKARYPGADLMEEVLALAHARRLGVYLAVRKYGLSSYEEVREALAQKYPGLHIEGGDYSVFGDTFPRTECQIVLCNFGIPDQEIFLADLARDPQFIRFAMGVGGSFDYATRKIRRAPMFVRRAGLEWLWRLILQPWRIKRMWHAVVIFPYKVWREKRALVRGLGKEGEKNTAPSPFSADKS